MMAISSSVGAVATARATRAAPARATSAVVVRPRRRVASAAASANKIVARASSAPDHHHHHHLAPRRVVASPARGRGAGARTTTTTAGYSPSYGGGGGSMIPVPDRFVALLPYLVPLLDGLRYSRFFFSQFPQAIFLLQPLQPIASMYFRIPFAGMISFFAIYLGIAENRNMSRFVRFNAMQAIILDIVLVLPGMVEYVLSPGSLRGMAFEMYKLCYNSVWVFVLAAFCLAAVGCMLGQMYKLPFIGDAADMRV